MIKRVKNYPFFCFNFRILRLNYKLVIATIGNKSYICDLHIYKMKEVMKTYPNSGGIELVIISNLFQLADGSN